MTAQRSRALLLGAGMVAPPLIRYLLDRGVALTVATDNAERAAALVGDAAQVVAWSFEDRTRLTQLIEANDLAISLLPATMHLPVAEACVAAKKHFVSTSYVSPEMGALDVAAKAAGVVLLNEVGVDPGIDHMSAMKVIDEVRDAGGTITGFRSHCGGLPAPEANDNPWGYKFSWSPLGVLRASRNPARYRDAGALVELGGSGEVFEKGGRLTVGGFEFESYANRDSLGYVALYGLQSAETMYRGTLRWPGWSETIIALSKLDLLSDEPPAATWRATLAAQAGLQDSEELVSLSARALGVAEDAAVVERLRWLGLFEDAPPAGSTVIEALSAQMAARMALGAGERDMLVMHHIFDYQTAEGEAKQSTSTMIAYGDGSAGEGHTAMAKTVGSPAAIGAKLILDGAFAEPGVQVPVTPALYRPILAELAQLGITLEEEITR